MNTGIIIFLAFLSFVLLIFCLRLQLKKSNLKSILNKKNQITQAQENRIQNLKQKINIYKSEITDLNTNLANLNTNLQIAEANNNSNVKSVEWLKKISEAFRNTQKSEEEFLHSIKSIANLLRDEYDAEYCSIGKTIKKENNFIFQNLTVSFKKKTNPKEYERQIKGINKVKVVNSNDPGHYLSDAFNDNKQYTEWTEIKPNRSKDYKVFTSEILISKSIHNIIVYKLKIESRDIGYIQLVNIRNKNQSILNDLSNKISELVDFAITSSYHKRSLKIRETKEKDIKFVHDLIKSNKDNVDDLIENIMQYLMDEFNGVIVSFRIPILNGIKRNILFYLRGILIHNDVKKKEELKQYYLSKKEILNKDQLGANGHLKCYQRQGIILPKVSDKSFYGDFDLKQIIKTDNSIILPVLKTTEKDSCLCDNIRCCTTSENKDCKKRFENLFGVFNIRIQESITDTKEIQERLGNLAFHLSFLFDSIIDKDYASHIDALSERIKYIRSKDPIEFDEKMVEILKEITQTKVCSIYRVKEGNLKLSASTTNNILDFNKNEICKFEKEKYEMPYKSRNVNNIYKSIGNDGESSYFYNIHTYNENKNHSNNYNLKKLFPNFIEIPDDKLSISIENIVSQIQNESFFIAPIYSNGNSHLGFILLWGKKERSSKQNLSVSFWEHDKKYIDFVIKIISRFADINETTKFKEDFQIQLTHELLSPITEIVYENDILLDKYKTNKESFSRYKWTKQFKNNLNAAILFKYMINDIELNHKDSKLKKITLSNVENPKELILAIVKLLEKKASLEKRINIRTNISKIPTMTINKELIQQVLINLLKNAIQYSHPNTEINIYYKQAEKQFNFSKQFKWHKISISNWGIGIDEEDKEKIFDQYYRSYNAKRHRPSGTGIGLSIVNQIITKHQGVCEIEKKQNPTIFSVYLPDMN